MVPKPKSIVWAYFTKNENKANSVVCNLCGKFLSYKMSSTSGMFKHLEKKHTKQFIDANKKKQIDIAIRKELIARECEDNTNYLQDYTKPTTSVKKSNRLGFVVKPHIVKKQSNEVGLDNEEVNCSVDNTIETDDESEDQKPLVNINETFLQASAISRKKYPKYVTPQKSSTGISDALLEMLSTDLLPKHIVDGVGFQNFVAKLCPKTKLPDKRAIENMMSALGSNALDDVKKEMKTTQNIAISVDTWKYRDSDDMITVIFHFIDLSWKMNSYVLDTTNIKIDYCSDLVATILKKITDDLDLTEKVTALSSNSLNEYVITAAAANVWNHLDCFGTKINDVLTEALNNIPEIIKIKEKAINAANFFKADKEGASSLLSVQKQNNLPLRTFKTYGSNDWLTTYELFKLTLEQYEAINTVLCYMNRDTMCLCDDEIEIIRNIMKVLHFFKLAANELSCENFVSASKVIPLANLLKQELTDRLDAAKGTQMDLISSILRQMEFKFKNFEENYNFSAATLLDPRFKAHGFKDEDCFNAAKKRLAAETLTLLQTERSRSQKTKTHEESSFSVSIWGKFDKKVSKSSALNNLTQESTTEDLSPFSVSLWNKFDKRLSESGSQNTFESETENEIRRYFKEPNIERSKCPLQWWNVNEVRFPNLKVLAKKYLAIPATCVQSDQLFGEQRDLFKRKRDMISLNDIQTMLFLNSHI